MDLINSCNQAMATVKEVQQKFGNGGLAVVDDDAILFEPPNSTFLKMAANFGHVGGSCFAANSVAEGEGLKKATLGKDARSVRLCQKNDSYLILTH